MKRKIVRMTQEELDTLLKTMDNLVKSKKSTEERNYMYEGKMHEYLEKLRVEQDENSYLKRANDELRALFEKKADTQVIKYNGKLYRITSTTNYIERGVDETLDFTAVPVNEVD